MMPQFGADTATPPMANIAAGLTIFVLGLAKKVVLADTCRAFCRCRLQRRRAGAAAQLAEAWVRGAGLHAADLLRLLRLLRHGDRPRAHVRRAVPAQLRLALQATSISEFWRRWHITLSPFLRDYLYIPLGGNRRGEARRYVNLMVTMLLGGLWHGAGWTFVLWGGLHGLFLGTHAALRRTGCRFLPLPVGC